MADTSESEASRFVIKGRNLSTDPSGLVQYEGSLEILSLALLDSGSAQHKGPGVRLTLTGIPTDEEIEKGDMKKFLKALLGSEVRVCTLDMSLRRNVEAWFLQSDSDEGPRVFEHITKLYFRFPNVGEPDDNTPKVSLQDVIKILAELAGDNSFPNLEELHMSGLREKSFGKAQNACVNLFLLLITMPKSEFDGGSAPSQPSGSVETLCEGEDELVIRRKQEREQEAPNEPPSPEIQEGDSPEHWDSKEDLV